MGSAVVTDGTIFEGPDATGLFLARVDYFTGSLITQATTASIKYTIYDLGINAGDAPAPVSGHEDEVLTKGDVVFDSLQTDGRWTEDTTGYNFAFQPPASPDPPFPATGTADKNQYDVRVWFTPTSGEVVEVRFRVKAI
jgi:hypothetical protein